MQTLLAWYTKDSIIFHGEIFYVAIESVPIVGVAIAGVTGVCYYYKCHIA